MVENYGHNRTQCLKFERAIAQKGASAGLWRFFKKSHAAFGVFWMDDAQ